MILGGRRGTWSLAGCQVCLDTNGTLSDCSVLLQRKRLESPHHILTYVHRFLFLGNHFNYASKPLSILTKVTVQQIVFTPCFNTYFFGMQAFLSGASPDAILERIKKAVPESIKNSIKLWPAVTALTFWFIQPQYRFMTTGVVAVFWQSYLSW